MAGIDKIYLKDYQEYKYFKDFCAKHTPEFSKKYNYELSPFDDITEETFRDGREHPISNFGTEADVFIIKHITNKDIECMPNVVNRLREQYSGAYDLILQNKSSFDTYYVDFSRPKIQLICSCNGKTLRHIKREKWDEIGVYLIPVEKDYHKEFNNARKCIYNWTEGRYKYYRYSEDGLDFFDSYLKNTTIGKVYKYITRTQLHKGTKIYLYCRNYKQISEYERRTIKDAEYTFIVV